MLELRVDDAAFVAGLEEARAALRAFVWGRTPARGRRPEGRPISRARSIVRIHAERPTTEPTR
jgi:hypothetical protein